MMDLWTSLDRIIDAAPDSAALRTHGLGPIAAWRMRQRGEPVPKEIERLALGAAYASVTAAPLLQKVIDILQEPVLVLKGPEVARLYPERTLRTYGDLDLLVMDLPRAERALIDAGFTELAPGSKVPGKHHDSPLQFAGLALAIELHRDPGWLPWVTPPSHRELLSSPFESSTRVSGAVALSMEQQALYLANHAWRHGPYTSLIHLVDIELIRQQADPAAINALARSWGLERIWRHHCDAIDWFIYQNGSPPSPIHRLWARHLNTLDERSEFGFYISRIGKITGAPSATDRLEAIARYAEVSIKRRSIKMH